MSPAVFGHGHLRLYLLSLLSERSMHGYELIQALSDRFGGTYVPSAGTIYPRLAKLEEDGLVTKKANGRKTVYKITNAGRRELAERESELAGIESELSDSVRLLADEVRTSVNEAMRTLRIDLAAAASSAREGARAAADAKAGGDRDTGRAAREQARAAAQVIREQAHAAAQTARAAAREQARAQRQAWVDSRIEWQATQQDEWQERVSRLHESNERIGELERLVAEFRGRLYSDLQIPLQEGKLEASIVELVRTRLVELSAEVAENVAAPPKPPVVG
jgi:DNA-binding PadR family transcriptional regulator